MDGELKESVMGVVLDDAVGGEGYRRMGVCCLLEKRKRSFVCFPFWMRNGFGLVLGFSVCIFEL
jgi:hypothetical protein